MSLLKDINAAQLQERKRDLPEKWWIVTSVETGEPCGRIEATSREEAQRNAAFHWSPKKVLVKQQRPSPIKRQVKESLLKELAVANAPTNVQTALKKSDATDAGSSDVVDKAKAGDDISFSLMRNTINANGKVTGSDVADYIERAEELNDEVDTIPFGLETDDGQIVKVYVNAEQADSFEEAMKKMLGMEDDIEEAINRLTTDFDIVDVVWPRSDDEDGEAEDDPDADLSIDDTSMLTDPDDDDDFADDQYDVVAAMDDELKSDKPDEDDDEIAAAGKADAEDEPADDDEAPADDEESEDEDEETDEDGNPVKKKKKKKKAAPPEPVDDEDEVKEGLSEAFAMDDIAVGGTVIYKVVGRDYYQMSKVRAKKGAFSLQLQNGSTIQNSAVVSTDASDWKDYKDKTVREAKEREVDSPSVAAAMKLMTSKGLHIKAMDEGPDNTVYIETDDGEEYVMRGDKRLSKERHGKKLSSYKKSKASIEENEQEKNMTIGSRFLTRVLAEASKEDRDGTKDGFNIEMDNQARALAGKLKLPFARRLITFMWMSGVPGRYLNNEEVEAGIMSATDMLRKKVSVRRAFIALYDGLATAKGYAIPKEGDEALKEAKSDAKRLAAQDPEKIMKAKEPVKKAKKALADHKKHYDGGTGMREKELQAEIDKAMAKLQKLTEEVELDEATRQKRGSFIQKLFETVLVALGLPESMITTTGPSAVGTGIYRTAELIEQNSDLEQALRLLATRLGIRPSEAQKPVGESYGWKLSGLAKEPLDEAADLGNTAYAEAVARLVESLGIPDTVFGGGRETSTRRAVIEKSRNMRNRTQVITMIGRLQSLLDANSAQARQSTGTQPTDEGLLSNALSKKVLKDLKPGFGETFTFDSGKSHISVTKLKTGKYDVERLDGKNKKLERHVWDKDAVEDFIKKNNAKFSHVSDHNN